MARTKLKGPGESLLETVRRIALRKRSAETKLFYPVRELARQLGVASSTIGRIYKTLEQEGLLISVRGSRTLLQGRNATRQLSIRSFVGLPIFLPSFLTLPDYRTFLLLLQRELWARGFAVATVHYDCAETQAEPNLAAEIAKHGFDIVFWHEPGRTARDTAARLQDRGIRVITIGDRVASSSRCQYHVDRSAAIAAILREWRSHAGVETVVVTRALNGRAHEELLAKLLEQEQLAYRFARLAYQPLHESLETLGRDSKEAVIFSARAAAMAGFRAAEQLARLCSRTRVAFTAGAPAFAFSPVPAESADLVSVDWQLVAARIVSGLSAAAAPTVTESSVFRAEAMLQVPLNRCCHAV